MNITLVEITSAGSKPEVSFNRARVRVGREGNDCDVAFDGTLHPMVSRQHAEFRCENGKWMIADLDSSYGVFVDGTRISAPLTLKAGSNVQLGPDGPRLLVIWLEAEGGMTEAAAPSVASPAPPVFVRPPEIVPRQASQEPKIKPAAQESWEMGAAPAGPKASSTASKPTPPPVVPKLDGSLEFVDEPSRPSVKLDGGTAWLGRDASCAVVIDGQAGMVSRRHAQVRAESGSFFIEDNKSFNGTLVNDTRISSPTPLRPGDLIRLGIGGPLLRFASTDAPAERGSVSSFNISPIVSVQKGQQPALPSGSNTMIVDRESAEKLRVMDRPVQAQLIMSVPFGEKSQLNIGRDERNEIKLDGLQISNRHARLLLTGNGVAVEDLKSTNGVYISGQRVSRQMIQPQDAVQIGAFLLSVDAAMTVNIFDTRSRTRIDVVDITRTVKDTSGGGPLSLLDSISLSIQPNEFVGVLGPSGAGKSMLVEVMNGMNPATSGNVRINGLDLHRHFDSIKQSIGFVPQEDIIHRELSVFRTLYYVAKMRLSRDVSSAEVKEIVEEVLDMTGLSERRDVRVSKLSGGQRKRVSIAVELITKPSVIFLDEPTSGLDPTAEERIMKLFRRIAESGRTVVLTTHAMENVNLFDKVVILMGGKLVFYGKPDEALSHFKVPGFKALFDRLDEPVEKGVDEHGESYRRQITDSTARTWADKFRATPQFRENVQKPLNDLTAAPAGGTKKKHRLGILGTVGQWATLSRRYLEVLFNDKLTLFILLAQAPIIALMTYFVMDGERPRDFVYFVLALVAMWFGTSVSAREIVRERDVYKRERMVNLGLFPYLASKLFVIGIIVTVQCLLLFVPLKIFDLAGLMSMPGELGGVPQLWAMLLTCAVGVGIGLFVSAIVRTSEMATSLVPLILIPQLLFSGLAGIPTGVSRAVSLTMPAAWSFDTMKRFSTLDTLEPEGANANGKTKGLGLYKYIEAENEKIVAKAKQDFEDLRNQNPASYQGTSNDQTGRDDVSAVTIKKIPDDLSGYVTFIHPWMNEVLNQFILVLMFGLITLAALLVLRLRDY